MFELVFFAALAQQIPSRPLPPPSVLLVSVAQEDLKVEPGKVGGGTQPEKAIRLTSVEQGVLFDLDADGVLEQVAWTAADAEVAFLAIDADDDGRISSGKELIGSRTVPTARNGIEALTDIMSEGPGPAGSIEASDPLYPRLLLWVDRNHNGASEADELRRASELFTRIGLGYRDFKSTDEHGNVFRFRGWVELRTAPGLNEATGARDHFERVRPSFEVVLKRGGK
jgi:hypothetical protein